MNIILESEVSLNAALRNDSFEEVLIGEGIVLLSDINILIVPQASLLFVLI